MYEISVKGNKKSVKLFKIGIYIHTFYFFYSIQFINYQLYIYYFSILPF
jgi:hypothetical protein